jgi:hypothetical protein
MLLELCNPGLGGLRPLRTFKREGPGDHADRQCPYLLRDLRDDRSRARSGSATDPGSDKHHIAALQDLV